MAEKNALNSTEIQQAMAEKRLSLRESIYDLEQETGRRVRQTLDHVQHKIISATDEIGRTVTKPIHAVHDAMEKVPRALRSKPMQTVLVVASVGATIGFMIGRRRNRKFMTRALLAAAPMQVVREQQPMQVVETRRPAARGFLVSIAMEVAHQVVLNSMFSLLRRRQ